MSFANMTPYIVPALLAGIVPATIFLFRRSSSQSTPSPQKTKLKFQKPVVRKSIDYQHGGVYHRSDFYLPVENIKRDTVAKDCVGSIRLLHSKMDSDNYALWDKNNDSSIDIGHVEYLRLFLISDFVKDGKSERYFNIYRKPPEEDIPSSIELPYDESENKVISITIQSINAVYPSEPYKKSLKNIVKMAEEA
jgi:hypothetical protein